MALRGCSVKTETKVKIMGWIELIGALALIIGITVPYTALFVKFTETSDENTGMSVLRFYNKTMAEERIESDMTDSEALDEYVNNNIDPEDDKLMKEFKMWLIPEDVELISENAALLGKRLKSSLIEFFGVTLTVITTALVVHCFVTFTMLVGAYKKKRGFVLAWLVLAVLEFIGLVGMLFVFLNFLPIMSSYIPYNFYIYYLMACAIRLYFNLIAYRLWKEIGRQTRKYTDGQLVTTLKGNEPLIVSMALPDHCFDPKK